MADHILRLFPPPHATLALEGLYLGHALHRRSGRAGLPYLYTNFIVSLDGRVSLPDPQTGARSVPSAIANPRDQCLYLELAAQADVLLTTARHLRAVAAGRQQELLRLDGHERLARWRRAQGLPPQPALAAVSTGLEIPVDAVREHFSGELIAITGEQAPPARVAALRDAGVLVLQLGGATLDGLALARALAAQGYQRIYSIAGPRVAHALLASRVVARLYLTLAHMALGGRDFDTLTTGEAFPTPVRFAPHEIHLDTAPGPAGQIFASFDPVKTEA